MKRWMVYLIEGLIAGLIATVIVTSIPWGAVRLFVETYLSGR